jgi:dihydroorotate dehydrogenase
MYSFFKPILFQLDPEAAHRVTMKAASLGQATLEPVLRRMFRYDDARLRQSLWDMDFANPVGLAAGFDKNALHIPFWHTLGFGFCEVGSVTAQQSLGNPKPRLFRLPQDEALINRMGLNNEGAETIAARLSQHSKPASMRVGINLAKTHSPKIMGQDAIEDFCISYQKLAPFADYVALNISCPNTEEGKTFEDPEALNALLAAIRGISTTNNLPKNPPLLVKWSPPVDAQHLDTALYDELLAIMQQYEVNGFICTNTASDRMGLTLSNERIEAIGRGGLSGKPLTDRSTALIRYLYKKTGGTLPIIGVGGVDSVEAAYQKIKAGASLVQLYTGLVYQGAGLVGRINRGIVQRLEQDGFSSVSEAVGRE